MTTTAKAPNYTAEQTAAILADYANGLTVEAIAEATGRGVRSIVAKLSREGVYKKKEYTTKTGEKAISKEELVTQIANVMGVEADSLGGLEKANKETLKAIFNRMVGV